jgi:hypothetical protein
MTPKTCKDPDGCGGGVAYQCLGRLVLLHSVKGKELSLAHFFSSMCTVPIYILLMRILVEQLVLCIVIFFSFAGSVSDTDPDSIGSLNPDPYPGRKKCPSQIKKVYQVNVMKRWMFSSVDWRLLRRLNQPFIGYDKKKYYIFWIKIFFFLN